MTTTAIPLMVTASTRLVVLNAVVRRVFKETVSTVPATLTVSITLVIIILLLTTVLFLFKKFVMRI